MSTPTPSSAAKIEALRRAYAALNRNDIDGFANVLDPQIERIEPSDFPMGGTYRGLEAVKEHLTKGRGTWAEGACEPREFVVAPPPGERIIVLIDVRVRLKHETQWRHGRIADAFTFRGGKAVQFRTFGDEAQAFEWAGIARPSA